MSRYVRYHRQSGHVALERVGPGWETRAARFTGRAIAAAEGRATWAVTALAAAVAPAALVTMAQVVGDRIGRI
jgi:hypothetical protein